MSTWLASSAVVAAALLSTAAWSTTPARFEFVQAAALSGPCCGDSGHDVAVDSDGSFFVVGKYGALDLDGDGVVDQRSDGGHDAIIFKARSNGDLAWVRAPRSPAMSFSRMSVALDRSGGAYLAGGFIDSMVFRSGERIVARGPIDGLLVRYDAQGEPLWVRAIGGDQFDSIVDVASDAQGNVYVAATVQGAIDVDADGRTDADVGAEKGLLVASYDPAGKLRWARTPASSLALAAGAIAVTAAGGVRVAAHYLGADVDFDRDGRPDLPSPGPDGASLLATFDDRGTMTRLAATRQWGEGRIDALAFADDGDLLTTGWTKDRVDLDGDGRPDVTAVDARSTPYVARLAPDGALVWARTLRPSERLSILDLASSPEHIALSGLYRGPLDLDGDGKLDGFADADGKNEGLIVILENDGEIHRVFTVTGPGADQARASAFSVDGRRLWMTGFVRLTADFDADGVPEGGVRCDHYGDIVWAGYELRTASQPVGR